MFLISLVNTLVTLIELVIIVYIFLGYFVSPYHPARQILGRVIEPLLAPIRRMLPSTGMLDFSPMVLLILVQVVGWILIRVLQSFLF